MEYDIVMLRDYLACHVRISKEERKTDSLGGSVKGSAVLGDEQI